MANWDKREQRMPPYSGPHLERNNERNHRVAVTALPDTEHPGHWGGPVFIFDINKRGFGAVIFGHSLVTVSLVAEQV